MRRRNRGLARDVRIATTHTRRLPLAVAVGRRGRRARPVRSQIPDLVHPHTVTSSRKVARHRLGHRLSGLEHPHDLAAGLVGRRELLHRIPQPLFADVLIPHGSTQVHKGTLGVGPFHDRRLERLPRLRVPRDVPADAQLEPLDLSAELFLRHLRRRQMFDRVLHRSELRDAVRVGRALLTDVVPKLQQRAPAHLNCATPILQSKNGTQTPIRRALLGARRDERLHGGVLLRYRQRQHALHNGARERRSNIARAVVVRGQINTALNELLDVKVQHRRRPVLEALPKVHRVHIAHDSDKYIKENNTAQNHARHEEDGADPAVAVVVTGHLWGEGGVPDDDAEDSHAAAAPRAVPLSNLRSKQHVETRDKAKRNLKKHK
eukprot:PhM_4_TR474/c0_g1_i1/m.27541